MLQAEQVGIGQLHQPILALVERAPAEWLIHWAAMMAHRWADRTAAGRRTDGPTARPMSTSSPEAHPETFALTRGDATDGCAAELLSPKVPHGASVLVNRCHDPDAVRANVQRRGSVPTWWSEKGGSGRRFRLC